MCGFSAKAPLNAMWRLQSKERLLFREKEAKSFTSLG
jgi:hypothetical protein